MSNMFFFDRQDRELMKMINAIIDYGPSSDLEHRIFNARLHPHGILNLTTTHEFRMAQAVINLLGSLTKAGPAEDRLAALRTLHDEVLHSAQTTFRYNTGRVLIQIMKAIIRSRHDEDAQLRLIHDFRKAVSGNPRIVREFLTRHHLMEMPEEWNQLGMLQKRPIDKFVRCRGCGTFIPISIRDSGDEIQLCADCPECGPYELLPEEKAVWRVDFTPVFESARKALNCAGMVNEIVSNALWSLGRAPVSGQSREIFACAGINTERNSEILGHLPKGKTPILLVLGDSPLPCKLGSFPSDQVFCFSQLERIEDGFTKEELLHIDDIPESIMRCYLDYRRDCNFITC